MELVNTRKGVIRAIDGHILTIAHRRGGTSKAVVNRKFMVGQVVCFTVDPVHLHITNVMLKSEADNIMRKAQHEEERVACMDIPDGLLIPDTPDFGEEDPVDTYFGKEVEDYDISELFNPRPAPQRHTGLGGGEDRGTLVDQTDYFGDTAED